MTRYLPRASEVRCFRPVRKSTFYGEGVGTVVWQVSSGIT